MNGSVKLNLVLTVFSLVICITTGLMGFLFAALANLAFALILWDKNE